MFDELRRGRPALDRNAAFRIDPHGEQTPRIEHALDLGNGGRRVGQAHGRVEPGAVGVPDGSPT